MASIKGGHCFTVRISRPWISECAFAGIARSQSGSAPRAGMGRGKCSDSAGSQRKIMRMGEAPEVGGGYGDDYTVIASEAKQSMARQTGEVDCFASLAMTARKKAGTAPGLLFPWIVRSSRTMTA